MAQMTRMRMAEVGMRLADSGLSHVSGHAPVGVLTLCPFDWMRAKAASQPGVAGYISAQRVGFFSQCGKYRSPVLQPSFRPVVPAYPSCYREP
jgi:hypothetical protein